MINELIGFVTLWINAFPPKSGVSYTFIPRTSMTGTSLIFKQHCKVPFGAYVETHEENKPTNTLKERTRGAICLGPLTNSQGSYTFLCLRTCRNITRKQFKELLIPESVIKRVEAIALQNKRSGNMIFCDRNGQAIPYNDAEHDDFHDDEIIAGMDDNTNADDDENSAPPSNPNNPPGIALESDTHEDDGSAGGNDAGNDATDEEIDDTTGVDDITEETHE
jgi:hypothetical protein